jgi:D-alanyl-D-alanine endopeptidase (penicillin-binding protein 7)
MTAKSWLQWFRAGWSALALGAAALAWVAPPAVAQGAGANPRGGEASRSAQERAAGTKGREGRAQGPGRAERAEGRQGAQRQNARQARARAQASARPAQARRAATRPRPVSRARAVAPAARKVAVAPQRLSYGQLAGLHGTPDPLDLNSSVALVVDQETHQVLFSKNPEAVLPIASITKLMTALVVVESGQPLDEELRVSQADVDTEKGSGSRLHVGAQLTRGQMLHLALMASENRAAHALGRHFPGGLPQFVDAMNRKAAALGMHRTRFVEPTGLSSANQSSAVDLAILVRAASEHQLIRELSTASDTRVAVGRRELAFRNTNGLIRNPEWDIGLQKTGYISEAGRCVVMQAQLAGRQLIMVLLDSAGRYSRIGDAERLRSWVMDSLPAAQAGSARALSSR